MQGHQARRERRMDDARRIFAEAVRRPAFRRTDPGWRGLIPNSGASSGILGETGAALLHYKEAAGVYRRLDEPLRLAHTVRHIGDILREDGQLEPAWSCYREALEIYRAHPETSPLDLANAIRGYALLQEEIGETTEALALWREARELYAAVNVQAGVDEGDRRIERLSRVA